VRTYITRPDGTILWQSEEFDPAFAVRIVPPADHPVFSEPETLLVNAADETELALKVAAPTGSRADAPILMGAMPPKEV